MAIILSSIVVIIALVLWIRKPRLAILLLLYLQLGLTTGSEGVSSKELLYILILLGVLAGWLFQSLSSRLILQKSEMNLPTGLIFVTIMISIVHAYFDGFSLLDSLREIAKYFNLVLVLLIPYCYKKKSQLQTLFLHFVIVAVLMGIKDFISIPTYGEHQLGGVEHQSIYFLLAIPLILAHLHKKVSFKRALFLFFVVGMLMIRALISAVRSYVIISLIMIILMAIKIRPTLDRRNYKTILFGAITVGLIFLLLINRMPSLHNLGLRTQMRFETLVNEPITSRNNISLRIRILEVKDSWQVAREKPFLGNGPGVTYDTYNQVQDSLYEKDYVHLVPLDIFLKFGFLGFACWVFWFIHMLSLIRKIVHAEKDPIWRNKEWAIYVNGVSFIILSFVNRVVLAPLSIFSLGLMGGIVAALESIQKRETRSARMLI